MAVFSPRELTELVATLTRRLRLLWSKINEA